MLQQLVMCCCAVTQHHKFAGGFLPKVTVLFAQIFQHNDDIIYGSSKVLGGIPKDSSKATIVSSVLMGDEMTCLNGLFFVQHQLRATHCQNGIVRQERDSGAVGKDQPPHMRASKVCSFQLVCTFGDSKLFRRCAISITARTAAFESSPGSCINIGAMFKDSSKVRTSSWHASGQSLATKPQTYWWKVVTVRWTGRPNK